MTSHTGVPPGGDRPDYGLDAPRVVLGCAGLGALGLALLAIAATGAGGHLLLGWGIWASALGLPVAAAMTYSSRVGKLRVRDRVLAELRLAGNEQVLDLGCGSGLMLLGAATRVPAGSATGIDLWRAGDQAGASRARCLANAALLGVSDRVRLVDGDCTELPFADGTFDLVLGCLAVHNVHPSARRARAITEAVRVLRPGGRLVLIDIAGTAGYRRTASAGGLVVTERSRLARGIFPPARLVTAVKPR